MQPTPDSLPNMVPGVIQQTYCEFPPIDGQKKGIATPPRSPLPYLGLSTGAANKAGTIAGEPPGSSGYARVAFGANYFAASPNEYTTVATVSVNVAPFTFPTPTGAWPTVLSVFMADAPTGGNVIWMANLSAPRTFGVGVVPGFAAGAIVISR
jgi:hypothetical protein